MFCKLKLPHDRRKHCVVFFCLFVSIDSFIFRKCSYADLIELHKFLIPNLRSMEMIVPRRLEINKVAAVALKLFIYGTLYKYALSLHSLISFSKR